MRSVVVTLLVVAPLVADAKPWKPHPIHVIPGVPLKADDALLVRPGTSHVIENTGPGKLYTLTVQTPDEEFEALIRRGTPVPLDDEDKAILARARRK